MEEEIVIIKSIISAIESNNSKKFNIAWRNYDNLFESKNRDKYNPDLWLMVDGLLFSQIMAGNYKIFFYLTPFEKLKISRMIPATAISIIFKYIEQLENEFNESKDNEGIEFINTMKQIKELNEKTNGKLSDIWVINLQNAFSELVLIDYTLKGKDFQIIRLKEFTEAWERGSQFLQLFDPNINNYLKELLDIIIKKANLDTSDPKEQELFRLVVEFYEKSSKIVYYKPKKVFLDINNQYNLIDPSLINVDKFTESLLYNRFKQYKRRIKKK